MNLNRLIICLVSLLLLPILHASSAAIDIMPVPVDIKDKAKLQRGARMFMNYCSGCHSLQYMRYNRMAKDLGLTTFDGEVDKNLLFSNLIFTSAKIQDPIQISMPVVDARQWFGNPPPDLSLVARQRGADWLYTYLKSFYADSTRPFGSNNLLVPNVAMPNVLAPLIGQVIAVNRTNEEGKPEIANLVLVEKGEMGGQEFDSAVEDLVNFLVYVGEPAQLVRYRIGVFVILFLCIFLVVAYQLKKSYWREIKGH